MLILRTGKTTSRVTMGKAYAVNLETGQSVDDKGNTWIPDKSSKSCKHWKVLMSAKAANRVYADFVHTRWTDRQLEDEGYFATRVPWIVEDPAEENIFVVENKLGLFAPNLAQFDAAAKPNIGWDPAKGDDKSAIAEIKYSPGLENTGRRVCHDLFEGGLPPKGEFIYNIATAEGIKFDKNIHTTCPRKCMHPFKTKPKTGAPKMLNIENKTRINGRLASDFSTRELLGLIGCEQERGQKLADLIEKGLKSKAVDKLVEKHDDTINKLAVILDANVARAENAEGEGE